MKQQILSLTLALSVTLGAMAQNFKNPGVPVNYLSIPDIIQSASINTYSVEVSGYEEDLNSIGYSAGFITDKLNLRAFSRVNGEGENNIIFRFSGYGGMQGTLSTIAADGKTKYYYSYTYTLPMSYEIYAGIRRIAGKEIQMKSPDGSKVIDQFTYTTSYFNTPAEATNEWNSKGKAAARTQIKKNFDIKFDLFVKEVKNQIDYQYIKGNTNFGMFKTTKKEDYSDYEEAAESAKRAFAPLVAGQLRTGLRERMDSAMTFWSVTMKTLDPTNKDQDKLYFACANNLANAYYWMDQIDSALYFISEAEKTKFRAGYLSMLKHEIESRRKQLASLNANGIDPYLGPEPATREEVKEIEAIATKERIDREAEIAARIAMAEKKVAPVIETYDGFIIDRTDKKVNGMVTCYKENNGARTGKNFFTPEGTDKEKELSPAYVKVCEFGSSKYELVKYMDAGITKETNLLLLAYESDKIKVYKLYSPVKDSKTILSYVFYKRPNEEFATNASSITFMVAYKKLLAKYFEDCPSVSSKALAGEYTDSDEMRVAAAIDYSNCK